MVQVWARGCGNRRVLRQLTPSSSLGEPVPPRSRTRRILNVSALALPGHNTRIVRSSTNSAAREHEGLLHVP